MTSLGNSCTHASPAEPVITAESFQLVTPIAAVAAHVSTVQDSSTTAPGSFYAATHSPPGTTFSPLVLRL